MADPSEANGVAEVNLPPGLEMIRLIGVGSMATVYLARDRALKRLVAVKILHRQLAADATSRLRFEREAQAAARLSHECVTTVFSVGRLADDVPYITMEYVDGGNLADLLRSRGALRIDEARALLVQLSSALAAAHAKNIVHRDVKPANVLLDSQTGQAALTDFGVAAILETGSEVVTRLTRENERFGDPRYMSPEQLRGNPLTGQSDVYSLGIIGYELLTGHGPFDNPEISNMASAHLRRQPPDLTQIRPDVPQPLADLLKRCLAKRPEHRPRTKDLPSLLENPLQEPDASNTDGSIGPLRGFLHELKQRKVYQAAATYAAVGFVALQIADLLLQAMPSGDAWYRVTVIACLAGFPFVVALAWIFDYRHGRLVRTNDEAGALPRSGTPLQRLTLKLLGIGISIGVAGFIAWWVLSR